MRVIGPRSLGIALIVALFVSGCTPGDTSRENTSLDDAGRWLSSIAIFFVGGDQRASTGEAPAQFIGQAQIHHIVGASDDLPPVIMYPGLGLSSYIWLSTPDGREGWAIDFARAGHPVYAYDPVATGPSGIDVGPFQSSTGPSVSPQTALTTWDTETTWPRFGFGPEAGQPYEDTRYPVDNIEQFYASLTTRLGGTGVGGGMGMGMGGGMAVGQPELLANDGPLTELLEHSGPAVLLAHSIAGATVIPVAAENPGLVAAIVVVEPVGCPTDEATIDMLAGIPFLAVYGDYIESRNQQGRLEACRTTVAMLNDRGGRGAMLELTAEGIHGNTHMLMQDDNSSDISARVLAWLTENL